MDNSLIDITDSPGIINWLAFRINNIIKFNNQNSQHSFHLLIDNKEVMTNTFYNIGSQFVLIGSAVVLPKAFERPDTPSSPELQPDTAIITFQPIKFYESVKFGITSQNSIDVEVAYNTEEYNYE